MRSRNEMRGIDRNSLEAVNNVAVFGIGNYESFEKYTAIEVIVISLVCT